MKHKIIIHIESGLGNQMLSYCELLALRKMNPDAEFFIETLVYQYKECNEAICQWNGYELERIFGIKEKNIQDLFPEKIWEKIIKDVHESEFWNKNWNYPIYITRALNDAGLTVKNVLGDFEKDEFNRHNTIFKSLLWNFREWFFKTFVGDLIKRILLICIYKHSNSFHKRISRLFIKTNNDIYAGQQLLFKYNNQNIEAIESEIHTSFTFPEFNDYKNNKMKLILEKCNGVAIHVRRGDMLGANSYCYKFGYFKRAVKYIRKHVEEPVFVFFTEPGNIEWCKKNAHIFNLDFQKDRIYFVDWNIGTNNFQDMQLMSYCKHAIITNSTFGWWGAYFIDYPAKITISPLEELDINTTYHC